MGQRCHRSRLPQLQPTVDPPQVAHPLHAEQSLSRIEEGEAEHWRVAGVALLHGLQLPGEAGARQAERRQLVEQRVVIGTGLLVDLDLVVLDCHPVPECLGMLLHRSLDGRHLLWQDG